MAAKDNPLVSICMPNYNYAQFMDKSIQSVLDQTYPNFELVIVDDKSTDDSIRIIKKYAKLDKRIRYYMNRKNLGMVGNYNKVMSLGKGEYVMLMAADDYYAPTILKEYVEFIKKFPSVEYIFCKEAMVNQDGKLLFHKKIEPRKVSRYNKRLVPPGIMTELLIYKPTHPLPLTSSLIKKNTFLKYLYNANHPFSPDWHLDTKIAVNNHRFGYISKPLAFYRIHGSNYGKIVFEKANCEDIEKFKIFEEFFPQAQLSRARLRKIKRNWFYSYLYKAAYSFMRFPKGYNPKYFEMLLKLQQTPFEKILLIMAFSFSLFGWPKHLLSFCYVKIYRNAMRLFFDDEVIA